MKLETTQNGYYMITDLIKSGPLGVMNLNWELYDSHDVRDDYITLDLPLLNKQKYIGSQQEILWNKYGDDVKLVILSGGRENR